MSYSGILLSSFRISILLHVPLGFVFFLFLVSELEAVALRLFCMILCMSLPGGERCPSRVSPTYMLTLCSTICSVAKESSAKSATIESHLQTIERLRRERDDAVEVRFLCFDCRQRLYLHLFHSIQQGGLFP